MRQKNLVIGLLVMLALVVSGFTYAIWSSVDLDDSTPGNVVIGEGRQALVTVNLFSTLPENSTLVPENMSSSSISTNPVEELVYTFDVDWSDNMFAAGTSTVTVSVTNIDNATEDLDESAAGLLNFAFNVGATTGLIFDITEGTTLTITLTVTLTEPGTQQLYNDIINQDITFDVNFVVADPAE
jgi:hypothetical protein